MTVLALAPFRAGMVLKDQASVLVWVCVLMHMAGWCGHVVE